MFSEALDGLAMTVTVNGEDMEARFKPGDLIRYERHFNEPLTSLGGVDSDGNPNVRMESLAFLAFAALTRIDRFEGDFDAFVDALDDIELDAEVPDPPTPAAA